MVDRVLTALTPRCPDLKNAREAEQWSQQTREQIIEHIGLDLDRKVLSVQTQRVVPGTDYRIEVVRIEVFEGIFVPANVYVPEKSASEKSAPEKSAPEKSAPEKSAPDESVEKVPLVMAPLACGAAVWENRVQRRAANLAQLGMIVVVTEGFCGNGMRASLPESRRHVGYSRQMLGLSSVAFTAHMQEQVSTLNWALAHYDKADPERIGAVGSSYGGHIALMLAQVDTRIKSLAIAGTYLGEPCDGYPLKSDIQMEMARPQHIWLAPFELPVMPMNWRLLTVYPRAVQVDSGEADFSAPPHLIGGAMAYLRDVYALSGLESRVRYATDRGKHRYNPQRRKNAYSWLNHTLLGQPLEPLEEQNSQIRSWDLLAVDISATHSFYEELTERIAQVATTRLQQVEPNEIRQRVSAAVSELFVRHPPWKLRTTPIYQHRYNGVTVEGIRMTADLLSFPVVVFSSEAAQDKRTLLYIPKDGIQSELTAIHGLLQHYERIVAIDYIGIGELASDRLRLHTLSRYLMYNDPSLPQLNINLLRSYLVDAGDRVDVWATSWPTSFYAATLKILEPTLVDKVYLGGLPESELRYLQGRKRVPDLLLWAGLFDKLTVKEMAMAIGDDAKVVR